MSSIEERLEAIEARNRKVEADKKWEGSNYRRLLIMTITYLLIGTYMVILGVNRPWLNAVIPTTGYALSTLTLGLVKQWWVKRHLAAD